MSAASSSAAGSEGHKMVQLLIECEEENEHSQLCQHTDAWRRKVFPTAQHLDPTPKYGSPSGWLMSLERAGSAGELQNALDAALNSTDPRPPFEVDSVYANDNLIRIKVSSQRSRVG